MAAVVRQDRTHLPRGLGILGHVIRVPDAAAPRRPGRPPALGGVSRRTPGRCAHFSACPIRIRNEIFGNLYLTEKRGGGPFTAADETLAVGAGQRRRRRHRERALARAGPGEHAAPRSRTDRPRSPRHGDPAALRDRARPPGDWRDWSGDVERRRQDPDGSQRPRCDHPRDPRGDLRAAGARARDSPVCRVRVLALAAEMTPAMGFEPRCSLRRRGGRDRRVRTRGASAGRAPRTAQQRRFATPGRPRVDVRVRAGIEVDPDRGRTTASGLSAERGAGLGLANLLRTRSRVLGGSFSAARPATAHGVRAVWAVPRETPRVGEPSSAECSTVDERRERPAVRGCATRGPGMTGCSPRRRGGATARPPVCRRNRAADRSSPSA